MHQSGAGVALDNMLLMELRKCSLEHVTAIQLSLGDPLLCKFAYSSAYQKVILRALAYPHEAIFSNSFNALSSEVHFSTPPLSSIILHSSFSSGVCVRSFSKMTLTESAMELRTCWFASRRVNVECILWAVNMPSTVPNSVRRSIKVWMYSASRPS